jgi:peptidoglycan/LPS O-acetylase OafA/YrhL
LGKGVMHRVFCLKWLRWLGGISYGVYVFHILLRYLYEKIPYLIAPHLSRNTALLITSVSGFVLTLFVSWLSFRFFESPFLRLKDRFQTTSSVRSTGKHVETSA